LKLLDIADQLECCEDGMTLYHHLFVNYDDSDDAKQMIDRLIQLRSHEANSLTHFGESALDLAVQ